MPAASTALTRRVFLVGPMGAGKTAVGRSLARALAFSFHDSDHWIEQRTGVDVGFIFEKEGEAGFRRRERAAIDELTGLDRIVLATGGGAVLDPDNRAALAGRGYVIFLHASVDQQLARTGRGFRRPLLDDDDPRAVLEALMRTREPLYREIADLTVDTDDKKVFAVTREIRQRLAEASD